MKYQTTTSTFAVISRYVSGAYSPESRMAAMFSATPLLSIWSGANKTPSLLQTDNRPTAKTQNVRGGGVAAGSFGGRFYFRMSEAAARQHV